MRYRREIDGLRGLAVLPVILFHAGFRPFRGGFIGVDVFFVISGYLISMLLLGELQTNSFSILRFYERRARRILPALLAVMGVSSVFACFWMLPDELKNFGESVIATTLFSNNILLAITSDYWALASEFKPLLHTWTLGVEEIAKRSDFRKAARWHQVHGDVLHFEGHELRLPPDWWERDYPDDSRRVLVKASRSLLKISQAGIVLTKKVPTRQTRLRAMFGRLWRC